jgi:hypothetical protein
MGNRPLKLTGIPSSTLTDNSSKYLDNTLNPYDLSYNQSDLTEISAQEQAGPSKFLLGVPRTLTKALAEVSKTPGYLYGIGEWASEGFDPYKIDKAFDNEYLRAFEGMDEDAKKFLQVFTPRSVEEGGFYEKAFSGSFWGT